MDKAYIYLNSSLGYDRSLTKTEYRDFVLYSRQLFNKTCEYLLCESLKNYIMFRFTVP